MDATEGIRIDMDREFEDDLEAAIAVKLVTIVGIALCDSLTLVVMEKVFTAPQVSVVEATHNDALAVLGHLELDIVVNVKSATFSGIAPFHFMRSGILTEDPQGPETTTLINLDRLGESEVILGYTIDGNLLLADALGGIHGHLVYVGRREGKHEAVGYLIHGNQRRAQCSGVCCGDTLEGGFKINMVGIHVVTIIRNSSVIGGTSTGTSYSVIDCTGWIIRGKVLHEIWNIVGVGGEIDGVNEAVNLSLTFRLDRFAILASHIDSSSSIRISGCRSISGWYSTRLVCFTIREEDHDFRPVCTAGTIERLHVRKGLQALEQNLGASCTVVRERTALPRACRIPILIRSGVVGSDFPEDLGDFGKPVLNLTRRFSQSRFTDCLFGSERDDSHLMSGHFLIPLRILQVLCLNHVDEGVDTFLQSVFTALDTIKLIAAVVHVVDENDDLFTGDVRRLCCGSHDVISILHHISPFNLGSARVYTVKIDVVKFGPARRCFSIAVKTIVGFVFRIIIKTGCCGCSIYRILASLSPCLTIITTGAGFSDITFGHYSRVTIMIISTFLAVIQSQFQGILGISGFIFGFSDILRDSSICRPVIPFHGSGDIEHENEIGRGGRGLHLARDEVLDAERVVTIRIRGIGHQVLVVSDAFLLIEFVCLVIRILRIRRRNQDERGRNGHQGFIDLFHFHFSLIVVLHPITAGERVSWRRRAHPPRRHPSSLLPWPRWPARESPCGGTRCYTPSCCRPCTRSREQRSLPGYTS